MSGTSDLDSARAPGTGHDGGDHDGGLRSRVDVGRVGGGALDASLLRPKRDPFVPLHKFTWTAHLGRKSYEAAARARCGGGKSEFGLVGGRAGLMQKDSWH